MIGSNMYLAVFVEMITKLFYGYCHSTSHLSSSNPFAPRRASSFLCSFLSSINAKNGDHNQAFSEKVI